MGAYMKTNLKITITLHPDDRDALVDLLHEAEENGELSHPFGIQIEEVTSE